MTFTERSTRPAGHAVATAQVRRPRADRELIAVAYLAVALGLGTVAILLIPELQFATVAPALDVSINAMATLVAFGVAGLAWARWRETAAPRYLFESLAFTVLAVSGLVFLTALLTGADDALGMTLANPGQTPIYLRAAAHTVAAGLILCAAWPSPRGRSRAVARLGGVLLGGYGVALVGIIALNGSLPTVISPEGLAHLRSEPIVPSALPGLTPLGISIHVLGAALWLVAAVMVVRASTTGPGWIPYLSIGATLAAFSVIHTAVYPGTYSSLVTTADILRLAFYSVLIVGITLDTRVDLRALRAANEELTRLRESEVAHAALEERSRLAREIHDGVAQELWLARLKVGELEEAVSFDGPAGRIVRDLTTALEAGLADTGHAVIALQSRGRSGFVAVLREYVAAFTVRFGLHVDVVIETEPIGLGPRREAECLRIVQEALNNVRKHADASVVHVSVGERSDGLRVSIADNGRGFDSNATIEGFGLRSMAERAAQIGARLTIESQPRDGTTVTLVIPRDRPHADD